MLNRKIIIFILSLHSISYYLLITTMMGAKAWHHVVYVIISFALLGYGIGSVATLLSHGLLTKYHPSNILSTGLVLAALTSVTAALLIIHIPIDISALTGDGGRFSSVLNLLVSYTAVSVPFVIIGFLLSFIFSENPKESNKLYFYDMIGAGLGSLAFFWMVTAWGPLRSILVLSGSLLLVNAACWAGRRGLSLLIAVGFLGFAGFADEPNSWYRIDKTKGWEYLPGVVPAGFLTRIAAQWHPLGLTTVFRLDHPVMQEELAALNDGTFQINAHPRPEYWFISTNYLAGTPIYGISKEGLQQKDSHVVPFTTSFELPYSFMKKPKVMIIGAGGGRDIHTALSHGAVEVRGAEINPATYEIMMPGGVGHEYSGEVYTAPGVHVANVDGRHLARTLPKDHFDLAILNGVDTFNSLSNGAHTFAESYLYTEEAAMDYLALLKPGGLLNLNRWLFKSTPRESLRLFATLLSALQRTGATHPWEHVMVLRISGWGMHLIKKQPFTQDERLQIRHYAAQVGGTLVFDAASLGNQQATEPPHFQFEDIPNPFYPYVEALQRGTLAQFENSYPFDISVVRDDAPFFYKYYKLQGFDPLHVSREHHLGTVTFLAQLVVLLQTVVFIILFIVVPLFYFKKEGIATMRGRERFSFLGFFACIGMGYMVIEIALIQQFVLLLGSPIYSFSVTLVVVLLSSGIGSFLLPGLVARRGGMVSALTSAAVVIGGFLLAIVWLGDQLAAWAVVLPFWQRVTVVALVAGPVGVALGLFFPAGLQQAGSRFRVSVAWAWGINAGFSVLGSMGSILMVQFSGFKVLIAFGLALYMLAWLSFRAWSRAIEANPPGLPVDP